MAKKRTTKRKAASKKAPKNRLEQVEEVLSKQGQDQRAFRLFANRKGKQGFKYIVFRAKMDVWHIEKARYELPTEFHPIAAYADPALALKREAKEAETTKPGYKVMTMAINESKGKSGIVTIAEKK